MLILDARGDLTARDSKRHIAYRFDVPDRPGAELAIAFDYAPSEVGDVRNLVCLSLFGPHGFRGAGHRGGASHRVAVAASRATPGYLPDAVEPGTWHVVIDTHAVLPEAPCRYRLTVELHSAPDRGVESRPLARPARAAAARASGRWYRGDLHCHTNHSDGRWDVATMLAEAARRDLDFVALTDHNTVSGLRELAALETALVTIPGMELTTFHGHALNLGSEAHVDWRDAGSGRAMVDIALEADRSGALFVIAHPCAEGDPVCTGCDWRYEDVMPGPAKAVEVWNGPWWGDRNNERALALYYGWLNAGHRLAATAGSDAHGEDDYRRELGFNAVWADEPTPAGILRAVAAGRLYLTSGPRLDVHVDGGGNRGIVPGGEVRAASASVAASWDGCPPGAKIRLMVDGREVSEERAAPEGRRSWPLRPERAGWALVELRGHDGRLLALCNPIFIAPR
jgi:hypothetical protein